MLYEAALVWVLLSGGYWGTHLLRRRAYPSSVFPWMMIGAAVASAAGLLGRGQGDRVLDIAGAVGLGAGVCLLLVGPLARKAARLCNGAERWRLARVCYEVAEVLQPGTGVREEKRLAASFARIQSGQSDEAVAALARLRDAAPPPARRVLDEHITMIYLTAWRWRDAIEHAESTLLTEPATGAARDPLREVSPPLWVELMGAYAREGDLLRAGQMLEAVESELAHVPAAAPLVHRARMIFLAQCGRVDGVRALTAREHSRFLGRSARHYWLGIAAVCAGDRALAERELRQAVRSSRGRRRRMSEAALGAMDAMDAVGAVSQEIQALAARAEQRPIPSWAPPPRPWTTWIACAACVAVAVAVALAGDSTDVGTLVRAGALVHGLVDAGQWWRIATAVLLHVGATHLAVNVMSLWVIGKLAEGMFGSLRTAALFAGCGLAGTLSSYLGGPPGIAAGASGAIFGMLGAVLGELAMHRQRLASARRSGMLGALLLVLVATVAIGVLVPGIDQWAHGGGVVFGALFGQALSPRHRVGRALAPLAGLVVAIFIGMLAWGAWGAARLTFVDSALSGSPTWSQLGDLEIEAPARWRESDGELVDVELSVILAARLELDASASAAPSLSEVAARWHAAEPARARARELETAGSAARPSQLLPAGWLGQELDLLAADAVAGPQPFRALSFVHPVNGGWIVGTLYAPTRLFVEGGAELGAIVATLRRRP